MTQPEPPTLTLEPPSEDNYNQWMYQWLQWPLDTNAFPARAAAVMVGYVHTETISEECKFRGLNGLKTTQATYPEPSECPDLLAEGGAYDLHALAITFWATVIPMWYLATCAAKVSEIRKYPPEVSITLRENGPEGPIARDKDNLFVRYDMVEGEVVYSNTTLHTGWHDWRRDPIPSYTVVVDNLFSPAIWLGIGVSALLVDREYTAPPVITPPTPPAVNFAPPMPHCGNILIPSTVVAGEPHTGTVPM